jgi:hypothetical protein
VAAGAFVRVNHQDFAHRSSSGSMSVIIDVSMARPLPLSVLHDKLNASSRPNAHPV